KCFPSRIWNESEKHPCMFYTPDRYLAFLDQKLIVQRVSKLSTDKPFNGTTKGGEIRCGFCFCETLLAWLKTKDEVLRVLKMFLQLEDANSQNFGLILQRLESGACREGSVLHDALFAF